ncbi:NAD(P)-dependent dehydrogenase, short-chain alcohol dehydrogenase family [Desulfocicer vacuolatum DSM 3385]|uniref:NAD(P)-dependent dehydrogenase, short-chain alcohol dehydrogenase family n=1 Tax=Desulfocicer vacuolatum DSM 3385 TaxID=1121400 RepID=A0A1W2EBI9_9BACT|nr:SDR family oxidoreductase [Desulfocicer vacuolatum]SMD07061.1 NAD(P)-dependent dehydrogenase, short-chain alcohol dehydrogenase family [Desulfocicer vacuolatum DSM 3385]
MERVNFNDRVAVVTGAGQGIGRMYALALARRGARVVVNDLGVTRDGSGADTSAADKVVEEIISAGGKAVANYDSVATMSGGENIVKTAMDSYGKLDILINNAGILRDKSFLKMTEEEWDLVMNVHLKGAFCVTQPAVKIMKANNYGRVVFTASISGLYGNFGQTNYGAAKLGLVGIMNSLKLEVAKYDIKVNTVAPNAWSRMTADVFPPEFEEKMNPQFNEPMVLYLCSEENKVSGNIFATGAGWYGRTAIVSGDGVCLGDAKRSISVEEIRDNFHGISNMDNKREHDSGLGMFEYMGPLLS